MGHGASREGHHSNRRYVHHKRSKMNGVMPPRAVPMAYVPPPGYIRPAANYYEPHEYADVTREGETIVKEDETNNNETLPEGPVENGTLPDSPKQTDDKSDIPKTNGYVKNSKNKKTHEHVVHKEKSYKLYEPEQYVQREKSYVLHNDVGPEIVTGRPRSYMQYEPRRTEYVVRESGHRMHEPKHARRIAHTYGTWRPQQQQEVVVTPRPVRHVVNARPVSEIVSPRPRTVRVIRTLPAMPTRRSVRSQNVGTRPVIIRRSVEPERMHHTTPAHGYIPRHTLGRYKPKVIDGYVAPSNAGERVLIDNHFSDPGGFREVILEPVYNTRTIPPPPYEGVVYEKEKVPDEKIETENEESNTKRYSNLETYLKPQTDDEKLKDIPMTQYFDDGKTIMIIDYLVDPFTKITKEPQFTSTPRYQNQNGNVPNENEYEPDHDVFIGDSHERQRPAPYGDVNFLP